MEKMNKLRLAKENFLNWLFFRCPVISKYFYYQIKKIEIRKHIDEVDPQFLDMINDYEYDLSESQKLLLVGNFPFFVYGKSKERKKYQKYCIKYLMEKYPDIFSNDKNIKKFFEIY